MGFTGRIRNTLAKSGPLADANTLRFSSKEWHSGAGLYYYGYRFYNASTGRGLSRDPLEEATAACGWWCGGAW